MIDSVLYGRDPHPKIVSIQHSVDNRMRIYVRKDSSVLSEEYDFYPFFHLADIHYITGYSRKHWLKHLEGNNYFQYLVAFKHWFDMFDCIRYITTNYKKETGKNISSYADLPVIHLHLDPVSQFLIQSGKNFYREMEFNNLVRIQIYIETNKRPGYKYSNPERKEDKIQLVIISNSNSEKFIIGKKEKSEIEIIEKFITLMQELDPDVIEGHHLQNFIIPYFIKRCEIHGIEFSIGRDQSQPKIIEPNYLLVDSTIDIPTFSIAGRQLIDTHILLQSYDITNKTNISYNLLTASEQLGYKSEFNGRAFDKTTNNINELISKCFDLVDRIKYMNNLLLPTYFEQAKVFPFSLDTLLRIGTASKIESILLREYVRLRHSIPRPQSSINKPISHTELYLRGIIGPVLIIEIVNLFPTIMLEDGDNPSSEPLRIFQAMLSELTNLSNSIPTFNTLANSLYRYLTYHRGLFNDPSLANKIAEKSNKILNQIITSIQLRNGTIIETDPESIIFIPPSYVKDEEGENKLIIRIQGDISPQYKLRKVGRYKKILSYKKKNYALLDYDNRIHIKGSALISKGLKRFGKNYIQQCIELLLLENFKSLHDLNVNLYNDILNHNWHVHDFMKVDTLKDDLDTYKKEVALEKRNRSAAYELALKTTDREWKSGDKIAYYITGTDTNPKTYENCKLAEEWNPNDPDENTAYYLKNLEEFSKRFEVFFNKEDFNLIFSNEEVLDLFKNIKIVNTLLTPGLHSEEEQPKDQATDFYSIWLADE